MRFPNRQILIISIYIEGGDVQALTETCYMLRKVITDARRNAGQIVDVVIAGDFNHHDQLWGGDNVSWARQGKANDIINLIDKIALRSLLPRGTKT